MRGTVQAPWGQGGLLPGLFPEAQAGQERQKVLSKRVRSVAMVFGYTRGFAALGNLRRDTPFYFFVYDTSRTCSSKVECLPYKQKDNGSSPFRCIALSPQTNRRATAPTVREEPFVVPVQPSHRVPPLRSDDIDLVGDQGPFSKGALVVLDMFYDMARPDP